MKKYDNIFITCIIIFVLVMAGINIFIQTKDFGEGSKEYKVAINRIEQAVRSYEAREGKAPESLEELCKEEGINAGESIHELTYVAMKNGTVCQDTGNLSTEQSSHIQELENLFTQDNKDYYIFYTDSYIYMITYTPTVVENKTIILYVNIISGILLIGLIFVYLYIRINIIKPFNKLSTMPYELAKGNMNMPLAENKNRFFGKFVWGMDLLRENIEENKVRELELQKERKMLLLSLSHDIKTPLSAIKLYSKALSKKLYSSEEKRDEILVNISDKVDEIEGYISEIVRASKEDFLHFEVENDEFYIKDAIESVREYYSEKMALNQIDFSIEDYGNSLVYGDKDRLIEVIQNIVENAIKYGDGKKIWLEMSKDAEAYSIKISNTGCMLSERELPHIFDSFFRGTNVDNQKGSGLGLYICRNLMHLMEGEITAELLPEVNKQIASGLEKSVISLEITLRLA